MQASPASLLSAACPHPMPCHHAIQLASLLTPNCFFCSTAFLPNCFHLPNGFLAQPHAQVFDRKDWEQLLARSIVPKLAFALQVGMEAWFLGGTEAWAEVATEAWAEVATEAWVEVGTEGSTPPTRRGVVLSGFATSRHPTTVPAALLAVLLPGDGHQPAAPGYSSLL